MMCMLLTTDSQNRQATLGSRNLKCSDGPAFTSDLARAQVGFIGILGLAHCSRNLKCCDGPVFTYDPAHAQVRFIAILGFVHCSRNLKSRRKPSNALLS